MVGHYRINATRDQFITVDGTRRKNAQPGIETSNQENCSVDAWCRGGVGVEESWWHLGVGSPSGVRPLTRLRKDSRRGCRSILGIVREEGHRVAMERSGEERKKGRGCSFFSEGRRKMPGGTK